MGDYRVQGGEAVEPRAENPFMRIRDWQDLPRVNHGYLAGRGVLCGPRHGYISANVDSGLTVAVRQQLVFDGIGNRRRLGPELLGIYQELDWSVFGGFLWNKQKIWKVEALHREVWT